MKLEIKQILEYEVHSHWLASYISFNWGQELMGLFFAGRVRRKYKRYLSALKVKEYLNQSTRDKK